MKNNSIHTLSKEQFDAATTLYPYICWADLLRTQFETGISQQQQAFESPLQIKQNTFHPTLLESEMYICLWFGVLYTVIEGWPALKLNEPHIEELLASPIKNRLRSFRNATSDSDEFDEDCVQALVATGHESIDWARKITLEYKSFFESIWVLHREEICIETERIIDN
jgi:hypothetical protein